MYSPADNCKNGTDRKAHDDLPLVEWWIQQIARYKFTTGIQLIDYVDVHYYPQAPYVAFGDKEDIITSTLRLRGTRSLYDPNYVDESWISAAINLIPRIREWINQYTPGLGIAVSEYNWGADTILTGALAQAETFGIFAREGVDIAARWVVPDAGSVVEDAYKIFINYDGKGSKITGEIVLANSTIVDELASFAFDDSSSKTLYVVLICKSVTQGIAVSVDASSAATTASSATLYSFSKASRLGPSGTAQVFNGKFTLNMTPLTATLAVIKY